MITYEKYCLDVNIRSEVMDRLCFFVCQRLPSRSIAPQYFTMPSCSNFKMKDLFINIFFKGLNLNRFELDF